MSAKTGYDDNISFDFNDQISDTYISIKPGIKGNYGSQTLQLGLDAYADVYRYAQEKELDFENYYAKFVGRYLATNRLSVTGGASYRGDTTLDSELEETGRVVQRGNRDQYKGLAGLTYELNEISGIELEYEYIATLYEKLPEGAVNQRVDRDVNSITVPYYRWVNNRLDRISLEPSYSRAETEDNTTIDYYSLSVGWFHIFDSTLRFRGRAGYGYTMTTEDGQERVNNVGNADLRLTKSSETLSLLGGFKSNIRLSSYGELLEVDRLYLRIGKRITERFAFSFYGSIYGSRPVEVFDRVDRWYYDLKPEFRYRFTEKLSSRIFYRYSREINSELEDNPERARNIIEFSLDYRINFEK